MLRTGAPDADVEAAVVAVAASMDLLGIIDDSTINAFSAANGSLEGLADFEAKLEKIMSGALLLRVCDPANLGQLPPYGIS